jgi:hypothetical protein
MDILSIRTVEFIVVANRSRLKVSPLLRASSSNYSNNYNQVGRYLFERLQKRHNVGASVAARGAAFVPNTSQSSSDGSSSDSSDGATHFSFGDGITLFGGIVNGGGGGGGGGYRACVGACVTAANADSRSLGCF